MMGAVMAAAMGAAMGVVWLHSRSSLASKVSPICDRFTLCLPYAMESLQWEVIFNNSEPNLPPDFVFDTPDFQPDIEKLQHLISWDARDTHSLSYVVKELYVEYKHFQAKQLSEYPQLHDVYNEVLNVTSEENIEIYVQPYDRKTQSNPVIFLIWLELPVDKIPTYMYSMFDEDCLVLLRVVYPLPDNPVKSSASFPMSPFSQHVIGDNIKLPALDNGLELADYLIEAQQFFSSRIELLDNGTSKRKAYMDAFKDEFAFGLVECSETTATTLINFLDFHFLLTVVIPNFFPEEQPKLVFRSVYHTDESEQPFCKAVGRSYPWSPRWSSSEMIQRLRRYLQDIIPTFQRASVMQGVALQSTSNVEPENDDNTAV